MDLSEWDRVPDGVGVRLAALLHDLRERFGDAVVINMDSLDGRVAATRVKPPACCSCDQEVRGPAALRTSFADRGGGAPIPDAGHLATHGPGQGTVHSQAAGSADFRLKS